MNQQSLNMDNIGEHLRALRRQQGMTLHDVQRKSGGKWKAVVVGSYERNDRTLSLKKAIELAAFYQVPLEELLGLPNSYSKGNDENVVLDLRALPKRVSDDSQLGNLHNFALWICAKRRDWNGEILSLRSSDTSLLALLLFTTEAELWEMLKSSNVLFSPR